MRYRTRTLLTGATLTLLAAAVAAGLGASSAAAAQAKPKLHKITSCGYVATAPGIYELTQSVADSGSGPCIHLEGDNQTLYLDGHTITGTTTDACVAVAGLGPATLVNDTVIGGTMAKPKKSATLTNCQVGIVLVTTSGASASYLKIVAPVEDGAVAVFTGGTTMSNINVLVGSANVIGILLEYGSDNVVTKSTVNSNGAGSSFAASLESGDSFTYDMAKDGYSASGNTGKGFVDATCSRNTFSHDTSMGNFDGFYFTEAGVGPVTATYNTATGPSTNVGSYGFYLSLAHQGADFGSPFHTLISHNKTNGFQAGFYDTTGGPGAPSEKWTNNTADNYSEFGFWIDLPTDFTMTGNIADANTASKKYLGTLTAGFYFDAPTPQFPFRTFANNQAYDSEYGFYSNGAMVGGKGNIAKRNKYATKNVEIVG